MKLLCPVMAHLRQWGLRCVIYLDNLILMAQEKEQLESFVAQTVDLLEKLGFLGNQDKSHLSPDQNTKLT